MRQARLSYDVTRFGAGYWIGAICSTLIAITLPAILALSDSPALQRFVRHNGTFETLVTLSAALMGYSVFVAMMVGAVMSLHHFQKAWRSPNRDRSTLVGGVLGFVLCAWPLLTIIALNIVAMGSSD